MLKKLILFLFAITIFSCSSSDDGPSSDSQCSKPNNLIASEVFSSGVDISWSQANDMAWEIQYGIAGFSIGSGTSIIVTSPEHTILNLEGFTQYDVYVRAICDVNIFSDWSNKLSFTTTNPCLTPSFFEVTNVNACFINLSWDISSATSWEIEYGSPGFQLGTGTTIEVSNSPYSLTDITPGTNYDIYIRGICNNSINGVGDYAGPIQASSDPVGYIGNYLCTTSTSMALEPNIGTHVFGDPHIVTITAPSDNIRRISVQYLKDLGYTHNTMQFEFALDCNGHVIVSPNQNTNFSCSGTSNVLLGPTSVGDPWQYDIFSDDEIMFSFVEFYNNNDGNCEQSENEVTITLTKQL
ncbi:hypothetical protein [Psychroserpens sp. MEBiC05023]